MTIEKYKEVQDLLYDLRRFEEIRNEIVDSDNKINMINLHNLVLEFDMQVEIDKFKEAVFARLDIKINELKAAIESA